jgi:hypothetical protein
MARGKLDAQRQIHPGRGRDQQEAQAEGEREAEPEMNDRNGGGLAGDREPAQADEGVEPELTGVAAQIRGAQGLHGAGADRGGSAAGDLAQNLAQDVGTRKGVMATR